MAETRADRVTAFLMDLQDRICDAAAERDGGSFHQDLFEDAGRLSRPRVLEGDVIERAGVNFTRTTGAALPAAATERRPEPAAASRRRRSR